MNPAVHQKEFIKVFKSICGRHSAWRVWSDFCEMAALEFQNALLRDPEIDRRYAEITKAYEPDEYKALAQMFAKVAVALEDAAQSEQPVDFLGQCFMDLELSSHWHGQFFTPIHLCQAMASVTLGDGAEAKRQIEETGLLTVQEPACGAGAMVIAFAFECRRLGINYQQDVYVVAIDKDPTAAHMTYVQLSMLGIAATVYVGDTLSLEITKEMKTPFYWMGTNPWKIRRWKEGRPQLASEIATDCQQETEAEPQPAPSIEDKHGQLDLFGMEFGVELRKGAA